LSFIGVIIILIGIAVGVPVAAYILDRKDYNHAIAKIENTSKRIFLENIAEVSGDSFALWKFKQDEAFTYSVPNKTLFSHYVARLHPFLSIFTKYDVLESRLLRFSIYFFQLSLYALICVAAFGKSYRKSSTFRNDYGLDEKDAGNIIIVGIIGMVLLLPVPGVMSLFRSKVVKEEKKLNLSQSEHLRNENSDNNDNTTELNIISSNPARILKNKRELKKK
jgi:hypothetical protein